MQLRDYQTEALDALQSYFERETGNPVFPSPVAAGAA